MRMGISHDIADEDVWLGNKFHPGTKHFHRAIRFAAEDFEDAEFSKRVYKSIKKELKGRRFFTGKAKKLKEVEHDDLIQLIADAFEEENERRWARQSRRSKQKVKKKECDSGSSSEDEDCESGRPRSCRQKKPSRRRVKLSREDSEASTSEGESSEEESDSTDMDMNIYIGNERKPGTKELLDAVRRTADRHPDTKFSQKIFARIMRGFKDRKFFWSLESHQEIPKPELGKIIRELWKMDIYMLRARPTDVYFAVSSHPGTQAWVRSIQQVIIEHGDSKYNRLIYKEIKRRLYDSKFYIGRPPECDEATKRERAEMFQVGYQREKDAWARIQRKKNALALAKMLLKVGSGILEPKHISDSCEDELTQDSTDESSSQRDQRPSKAVCLRAVPGNLYWMQLSQRMKNSEVLHRIRNSVTGCSTAVAMKLYAPTCCIRFSRFSRSFGIGQRKLRRFLRKDIASGEDVFNRIYMHLEITIVGQTTAALALVSLSCLFMLIITLIFHSILKGILLPLV